MADIAVTVAQVAPVNETEYVGWTLVKETATDIAVGDAVAIDATGFAVLADASTAAENGFRGICVAVSGNALTIVVQGSVAGFTLTGADFDDPIFLSNTAGALDDAAGGDVAVRAGRVRPMYNGSTPEKVLYVNATPLI